MSITNRQMMELAAKATPGPWEHDGTPGIITAPSMRGDNGNFRLADVRGWGHLQYLGEAKGAAVQDANGDFIAAARSHSPWAARLLEERVLPLLNEIGEVVRRAKIPREAKTGAQDLVESAYELIATIEGGCPE